MRFLRSVAGYKTLDGEKKADIREDLVVFNLSEMVTDTEISGKLRRKNSGE